MPKMVVVFFGFKEFEYFEDVLKEWATRFPNTGVLFVISGS